MPPVRAIGIEECHADSVALIEQPGVAPVHFVGLSMGGYVAMRLAACRPDLVRSCTLLNTIAGAEPAENLPRYRTLNRLAKWFGLRVVANKVMPIMFGRTFQTDPARVAERDLWRERLPCNRREILARCERCRRARVDHAGTPTHRGAHVDHGG